MRGTTVLLCLAAITATTVSVSYVPGHQYVYDYQANIYTELKEKHHQHSGFSFKSKIYVQPGDGSYTIRFDDFVYDKTNTRVTGADSYNHDYREHNEVSQHLEKPFKVYFEHGLVKWFKFSNDETEFSLNLKKGLATLFQLNFDQVNPIRTQHGGELLKPDPLASYYRVMEGSLVGECEMMYEVTDDYSHYEPVLNVTKSRNYQNCVTQAYKFYHSAHFDQCAECATVKHPIHMSDVYHYNIRGDRHSYIIDRVDAEGEFFYTPYTVNGDKPYTHVNRTLVFLYEKTAGEEIKLPVDYKVHHGIEYESGKRFDFHELVDLKKAHYLHDILHQTPDIETLGKLFNDLIESPVDQEFTDSFKTKKKPLHFVEFLDIFATANYDEINQFYNQFVNRKDDENYSKFMNLFVDILSASGTNPSIVFARYLIQKKIMPANLVPHFLVVLPQAVKEVHEILLDEIYRLCENDVARNYPKFKSNCLLALSSVVYENCVANYYTETTKFPSNAKHICSPEDAEKYFDYIVKGYDQVETSTEKLTNIKVAGNFGIKKSVDYLKEYAAHSYYPNYYRITAIFALRRVAVGHPEVIKSVMLPLYFNQTEPYQVRIAAFISLLMTDLPVNQMDAIAQGLAHEPSNQVVSFVYSVFYHISQSNYPCYAEMKKNVQVVLRHLDRLEYKPNFDFRTSYSYFTSGYDEKYDLGGATTFSYVTSNDSRIPNMVYLGMSDYFGGKHFDSLAIAYHGFGLDKFFDRIFGPEGIYKKKTSIFDYFRKRNTRDTSTSSVEKELKEIDTQLHIAKRDYEPINGDISIRVFGNEISFFHFDEELFEEFLTEGAFGVGNYLNPLDISEITSKRFIIGKNTLMIMPLDIGIPTYLDYKEPIFYSLKNIHSKFEVSPSLFLEDRNGEAPAKIGLNINANLVYDHVMQTSHGVILLFEHSKFGVGRTKRQYVSAPIKFELGYDVKSHKLNFKLTPVLDLTVLHKCSKPFTFIDFYNNQVPLSLEKLVIPYYSPEEMVESEHSYFHDWLGYGVTVVIHNGKMNKLATQGAFRKYYHENDFRTLHYYFTSDPHISSYEADFRVTAANQDVTTEIDAVLDFDFNGIRDNKPYKSDIYNHEDNYEDHVKLYPGRKFYTYVLKGEIVAKGTKERKAVMEATVTHSCDHQYRRVNFFFDRTPFTPQETEHFKICLTHNMRYPQYDMKKLHELDTLELDQQINWGVNINFGKDCQNDKKVTIRGVMKKSEEQITLENNREVVDHLHFNPYSYYYHKCKDDRTHEQYYSINCRKYIYYATKMHHYDFNINYDTEMTPEFMNATVKWHDHFNHMFYYYMDQQRYDIHNEKGKAHVEAVFSVTGNTIDVKVERPKDRAIFTAIPTFYKPISASPYLGFTNLVYKNKVFLKPACTVQGDFVHTFDNITFELPSIDCYKVIAKDCSAHEYFTVLGKKITHSRYTKAVKVFIGKYKVEALPVTEDSAIIIRVNGKKVVVTETEPYLFMTGENSDTQVFRVVYNGLYYSIVSPFYGVSVVYDGKAIITELSAYYRGKQCGLCGDFNNERQGEFRGPENCVYHNVTEFGYSYAIPDDTCQVPEIKNPCELEHAAPCTVMRNRYIYVGTRQRQMCFTTHPIAECSKDCVEGKKVVKNVGFYCLDAKAYFTRFLQRESRDRPLHEVQGKPANHFAEIEAPEECHPREI